MPKARIASIQVVKEVAENNQCEKIRWNVIKGTILLDTFTAKSIMMFYNSGNEETKAKMERMIQSGPIQFNKIAGVCTKNVQ